MVGVPDRLTTLNRHSGHGRVWTEVLDRLSRMTDLVVGTDKTADVWLDNGHDPDPEVPGPIVACAYEVSWGTPELDAEFPPDSLRLLSNATAQAMARATHVVTGARASKRQKFLTITGFHPAGCTSSHLASIRISSILVGQPRGARSFENARAMIVRILPSRPPSVRERTSRRCARHSAGWPIVVFPTSWSSSLRTRPATLTGNSFAGRLLPSSLATLVGFSNSSIPPTRNSPA